MKYLFAHAGNLLEDNVKNLKMTQLDLWIIVKQMMNQNFTWKIQDISITASLGVILKWFKSFFHV